MSTKIKSKWVNGLLEFFGVSSGKTVLRISESGIEGNISGALKGSVSLSKATNYELTEKEKENQFISLKATAGSKTMTLGLPSGQIALIYNEGDTNAFTLKNVSGDTGTSLAAGELVLVVAGSTANSSNFIPLN